MRTPAFHDLRSYWRTFWVTAAILGLMNTAIFAVYWSAPRVHHPKSSYDTEPDVPDWVATAAYTINFPGILVVGPFIAVTRLRPGPLVEILALQSIATPFWVYLALWVRFFWIQFLGSRAPPPQGPVGA